MVIWEQCRLECTFGDGGVAVVSQKGDTLTITLSDLMSVSNFLRSEGLQGGPGTVRVMVVRIGTMLLQMGENGDCWPWR